MEFTSKYGEFLYIPETNYIGTDSVLFHAVNEDGETETRTLTINVKAALCDSKKIGTLPEEPVPVYLFCYGPWLEPESEEEEWEPEPISYEIISSPEHGEISEFNSSTGELTYTPDSEFSGDDEFTYRGIDSYGASTNASVEIVVGGEPACDDLLVNDEPGEPAQISLECSRVVGESSNFTITGGPAHGSIEEFEPGGGTLIYRPNTLFLGQDSFTYEAENWAGKSNESTVTINVCAKPILEVSGEVWEAEVPGVDLDVEATPGYLECEIDETYPELKRFEVFIDNDMVYAEERQCGDAENPCGRAEWERHIQLPYADVIGSHDYRVQAEDRFGNKADPVGWSETTAAEGTISQIPPEAEDSKESKGCETLKNRYKQYKFKNRIVYGTPCADKLYAYPKHGTTIYVAGGGDDLILASGEIDTIQGGAGNDRIYAGRGNDLIIGGDGNDQISGGSGDDEIAGKGGADILAGTSGVRHPQRQWGRRCAARWRYG